MTLLINATTTGWVVTKLGLTKQSDLQKNILVGLAYKMDKTIHATIKELKENKHFCDVDWKEVEKAVQMNEIKENL